MTAKIIGLDIAKHVFQVHGADRSGKAVLKKRLRREQVSEFFASVPRCTVAMEATRGAHYWARVIGMFGHEIRLIAPQFVKPYVRGQKNDMQDAAAICEAASRPEMRFVPQKSVEQQDMQMLHRIRTASDSLTKVAGNHTFKFGFYFERSGENDDDQINVNTVPGGSSNQNGTFVFTDTRHRTGTSGVGLANLALGLADSYTEIGPRAYTIWRGQM